MCLSASRSSVSFCLYCDKYFCLWTFIRQVNPSVAPAAVLEGETELPVHDTNVKSTHVFPLTDRKREPPQWGFIWCALYDILSTQLLSGLMFLSSVYVLAENNRNHFGGHDQSSRTKRSIQSAGIIPKWRLLPSCHPRPAGVWEVQSSSSSSSQLQLHPPSHSWPQGASGGASPSTWAHTLLSVNEFVSVGSFVSSSSSRKWCEPDWVPEKGGNREALYAADAGSVCTAEWVELAVR